MLDALRFVANAIGKKDAAPELTHFKIRNHRITAHNGKLTASSPIELDIDCCPNAEAMIRAIDACEETPQLKLTPTGKLSVRAGNFRTLIETIPEAFTGIDPDGQRVSVDEQLLKAFRTLLPFVSDDPKKIWANGVLIDGASAFATNNIALIEYWTGYAFPFRINIPGFAVKEILRVGEPPEFAFVSAHSATFYFSGERWIKTQLYPVEWPKVAALLDALTLAQTPMPEDLFTALKKLKPFVGDLGHVHFSKSAISTVSDSLESGTVIEVPGIESQAIFSLPMLLLLEGVADRLDLHCWPAPVPFHGARVRGAIAGVSRNAS